MGGLELVSSGGWAAQWPGVDQRPVGVALQGCGLDRVAGAQAKVGIGQLDIEAIEHEIAAQWLPIAGVNGFIAPQNDAEPAGAGAAARAMAGSRGGGAI